MKCCCGLLVAVKVISSTSALAASCPSAQWMGGWRGLLREASQKGDNAPIPKQQQQQQQYWESCIRTEEAAGRPSGISMTVRGLGGRQEEVKRAKERRERGGESGLGETQRWRWRRQVVSGGAAEAGMANDAGRWANRPAHLTRPITTATVN